jgi:hypothetical protein
MFRRSRETMIALRARHEAFRIATEIDRPHMEAPPPPEPAIPLMPHEVGYRPAPPALPVYIEYIDAPRPQSPVARVLMSDLVLSLLMILIGAGVIVLCKFG